MPVDAATVDDLKQVVLLLAGLMAFVMAPLYLYLEHLVERGCAHCDHCQRRIRERAQAEAQARKEYEKRVGLSSEDDPRDEG